MNNNQNNNNNLNNKQRPTSQELEFDDNELI